MYSTLTHWLKVSPKKFILETWTHSSFKYCSFLKMWFEEFLLYKFLRYSLVAQRLKHLPATWETQVQSLGREDPLEKEMVNHSSILAWRIPRTEKPCRLQSTGSQRVRHDWVTSPSPSVYSCLLFLIFSTSVRSLPSVLYCAHLCMKCSLGISKFFWRDL